ncbi:hypothetical protein D3C76_1095260 [compost metagenome]
MAQPVLIHTLVIVRPARENDMSNLKLTLLALLSVLLLSGCVSQHYVGVQISSTEPMSVTRIWVNGEAVVVCREGDEKNAPAVGAKTIRFRKG